MIEPGFYLGLEQEFFVYNENRDFVTVPHRIPRDNAGFLAEARGKPSRDVTEAVFSLKADVHRLTELAIKDKVELGDDEPWANLPIKVLTDSWKKYGLPPKTKHVDNLYGLTLSDTQLERQYAGIHITISRITTCGASRHTQMFDFVPVIKWFDEQFKEEIKNSERLRGSYAVKNVLHGVGVEYRSLPTTINLDWLLEILLKLKEAGVLKYA